MKPCGLALFDRALDVGHRRLRDERRRPALRASRVGHAGATERRVDVERVGGDAIAHLPRSSPSRQVRRDDLEVVVGRCG